METSQTFKGDNKLLFGIFLGVITFWLFASSLVNIVPDLESSFDANYGTINVAVSLTSLLCGLFVVGAGGLADRYGRVKMTYIGLILSVIGSLMIIIPGFTSLLVIGRAVQGLSAAFIMPSTLAIINEYYIGRERQRALSYWSIGSWGGTGICSFFGGIMSTFIGWRSIFIISIIVALLAMYLIKHTPETKGVQTEVSKRAKFDIGGLVILIISMLSLNLIITKTEDYGLFSTAIISLIILFVISLIAFILFENRIKNPLIDFKLFKHKGYSGAVVSNFLLNAVAGTLIVANTYFQSGLHFSSFQSGVMTITYLIAVLVMIRVGEKILQSVGPKRPMLIGAALNALGIVMISLTFLPTVPYVIMCVLGYLVYGVGLGLYATPSTDTAVSTAPEDKVGVASGVYKMASSLGNSFGVAISGSLFSVMTAVYNIHIGAMYGLLFNAALAIIAFIAVYLLVPKSQYNN
ncbi:MFS transporter [Staphylococcus gallinarum]|jgi:DHA2 family multidrug resistance protein-like MFS transporter|uniref:Quinolone resistance protein NorB n=1 Tax=Staphylococcus gallinarum TaxID=1293 RepID=A0A0D0SPP5_STAGA|nr:MFS transporter [Staphylococcus gallinarum]KIR11184.1 quinolone resistance protein [Staphylococcus gallinarum]MBU7217335.1 MFS transporter [Staphylococcus gallinarum]MCD8792583.1 MFS transporter [Staphylococcus gallinarum]MCD8821374.1 MFS transporter [Staphylococcus gallinarum]MCD8826893.1 MFS transporter [Staphylococcus gallinarum]